MKKFFMLALAMFVNSGMADVYRESINTCDEHEMRAALDRATIENRAVITVVECENGVVKTKTVAKPVLKPYVAENCHACAEKHQVIKREYFVRETVQTYKPIVTYVPAGTYTRERPVCNYGC